MLPHNADISIIPKPALSYLSMKTLIEVHREGNYFVLKKAYFSNPDNNPGIFSSGGHSALITLFTRTPDTQTEPDLGLFYRSGDEVPQKRSTVGKLLYSALHYRQCFCQG